VEQAPLWILSQVQGTDILVLRHRGSLFFWDTKSGARFPFPDVEFGQNMTYVSGPVESPGICSLALLAGTVTPQFALRYSASNVS
jgi:hypothetical protein